MKSKTTSYISILAGAATLFAGGYYFGLKNGSGVNVEFENTEYQSEKKDSDKSVEEIFSKTSAKIVPQEQPIGSKTNQQSVQIADEKKRLREILEQFVNEPNPVFKYATLARAMKQLNPENLDETLEVFENIPFGFENMQEYRMLLYAWSQFDPYGAIDYCKSRASGIGAGFAVSGVLEGWAARNPQEAKSWVESPENKGMAKLYNFGLIKGWASTDLEGASEYVLSMEGGDEIKKLAGTLTDFYNKRGFDQASKWAEEIENTNLKEAAFTKLSRTLARDQPERMAGWLEQHADKKYSVKAFENLGTRWSETNPEAAISFFSDLPAGKTQEVGIKSVIGNWAKQDPLSAGEWLNERPAGPELDSALSVYASTVANENAGAAMEWAISISQEKLQQQTIRKVGQEWYRQDKEAVEEWLPESGLSEDLMNSIRKPPKKNWWQQLSP
ncbi:MAG: hypothetical protein VX153_04795 [Verrucomicrobiota bacterium]|nr:hypothetical protein [Verrucomicrobiota bacterium]